MNQNQKKTDENSIIVSIYYNYNESMCLTLAR